MVIEADFYGVDALMQEGQSFETVGIYLSRPGHGQLYVAMSRAGIAANTKLFVVDVPNIQGKFPGCEGTYTKNVVFHEVLTMV